MFDLKKLKDNNVIFWTFQLPEIRKVAAECGWAIGIHGSVVHDLWTLPKYEQQFTDAWSDDDPDAWAAESPKTAFAVLIRKMCGKKAWDSNPWVWVYEFSLIK